MIMSGWYVICTIIALATVDRLGRKPLLLLGTLGMTVGMAVVGVLFHRQAPGMYVIFTMALVMGAYMVSVAPLTWLIMAEIFPNQLRGKAMGVASVCVWIAASLATFCFPPMVDYFKIHFGTPAMAFWIYAVISAAAFLFSLIVVPKPRAAPWKNWERPGPNLHPNKRNCHDNRLRTRNGKGDRSDRRIRRHRPGHLPPTLPGRGRGRHDRPENLRGRRDHRPGDPNRPRHHRVSPLRCGPAPVDQRHARRGAPPPRPHRRGHRQRGHGRERPLPRHPPRPVAGAPRLEPHRQFSPRPGGGADHGPAGTARKARLPARRPRQDPLQRLLGPGTALARGRLLRRRQGGTSLPGPRHGPGTGRPRHPRQRDAAGHRHGRAVENLLQDRPELRPPATAAFPLREFGTPSSAPTPSSSWPATKRITSPASRSWSTAAPACRGGIE